MSTTFSPGGKPIAKNLAPVPESPSKMLIKLYHSSYDFWLECINIHMIFINGI